MHVLQDNKLIGYVFAKMAKWRAMFALLLVVLMILSKKALWLKKGCFSPSLVFNFDKKYKQAFILEAHTLDEIPLMGQVFILEAHTLDEIPLMGLPLCGQNLCDQIVIDPSGSPLNGINTLKQEWVPRPFESVYPPPGIDPSYPQTPFQWIPN